MEPKTKTKSKKDDLSNKELQYPTRGCHKLNTLNCELVISEVHNV